MKRTVSGFLALLLALMMFPFIPSVQTGDYDVPAYAAESTTEELDIKEYVANNIDDELVTNDNGTTDVPIKETEDFVEAISLMVIKDNIKPDDTFNSIYADKEYAMDAVMGQYSVIMPVYDIGDERYNVAYAGASVLNSSKYGVQDVTITKNNLNAEHIDEAYYDYESGIVYIPKSFYADENANNGDHTVKVQMLVPTDLDEQSSMVSTNIHIENNNNKVTSPQENFVVENNQFNDSILIPIATSDTASQITTNQIHIYLNSKEKRVPYSSR